MNEGTPISGHAAGGYAALIAGTPELAALGKGAAGDRRRNFVLAYVSDPRRNAARAYRAAYGGGDSEASIYAAASRLLRDVKVLEAVEAVREKIRESALPRMLDKLEAIIHTELRDVMSWDGQGAVKLLASEQISPAASAALASISDIRPEQPRLPGLERTEAETLGAIKRSVKLHDPLKAMEIYAKLAGLGAADRLDAKLSGALEVRWEE